MRKALIDLLVLCCCLIPCKARNSFRVMFYNVENFFDCKHDSLKNDYEYLPGGIRGWTPARFWKKTGNISKVIAAIGVDKFPEIVGLAEVENEDCIRSLVCASPLKNAGYSYVYQESPDERGIEVCLLYNRYLFSVIRDKSIHITFKNNSSKKTRDVLYVCGKTYRDDTLHIFVSHFPSKMGGDLETEPYRREVAVSIREQVDSILLIQERSNILIMGDFNDNPNDISLVSDLGAKMPVIHPDNKVLYNLMQPMTGNLDKGTNKHQGDWNILDQMLVSGNLLRLTKDAHIFDADFLFVQDARWMGRKPFRTYNGMVYQGGFSDHLPVYMDIDFNNN